MIGRPSGRPWSVGNSNYSAMDMLITPTPITSYIPSSTLRARNFFHYRNPTVDDLLDEARRETNDLRRVTLLPGGRAGHHE